MKIDLSKIDTENFNVKEGLIAGETCYLITPKLLSTPWTRENKIFRSSIWNKDGELISASLPKFTNWGEREDLFPLPKSLEETTAVTKIDGSALIVSKYKGQLITRTRGTFDVSSLENGAEINLLKEKYPKAFDFGDIETCANSRIFEWVTPSNLIVLKYSEPELYLIGSTYHEDYGLARQSTLDVLAREVYKVNRPESYVFLNIPDMLNLVKDWKGKEGICLYSNDDQDIHKIKSAEYLLLHHFKSNATLNNVLDLFFEYGCPGIETFKNELIKKFDYECWKMVEELSFKVNFAYIMAQTIEEKIKEDVNKLSHLSQKDFAIKNLTENKDYSSYYFEIRGKNELSKKSLRKLMERELNEKIAH